MWYHGAGIRNAIRAPLRFGQMAQHDDRCFRQPHLRGCKHPTVPSDQPTILANKAGNVPAKLCHAGRDLGDLVCAMGLGIAGIGLQVGW